MQAPVNVDPSAITSSAALWSLVALTVSTLVAQIISLSFRYFEREQRRRWQEDDRAWRAAMTMQVTDAATSVRDMNKRVPGAPIRVSDVAAIVDQRRGGERRHGDSRVIVERHTDVPPDEVMR